MASILKPPVISGIPTKDSLLSIKSEQIFDSKISLLTNPDLMGSMVDNYLLEKGYEIPGRLPTERPVPAPEPTPAWDPRAYNPLKYIQHYMDEHGRIDYDRLYQAMRPQEREISAIERGTQEGPGRGDIPATEIPSVPALQQLRDTARHMASGKIDPFGWLIGKGIKIGSFGLIDIPELVGIASGKPEFAKEAEQFEKGYLEQSYGYEPEFASKAIEAVGGIAGALASYSTILRGAGKIAAKATNIPILRAVATGEIGGALSGLLRRPEGEYKEGFTGEGFLKRIKQIPGDVLFFTLFEAGVLTAQKALEIYKWNREFGKVARPIEFTKEKVSKLYQKMQVNSQSSNNIPFTEQEKTFIEFMKKPPGWKEAVKRGYVGPIVEGIPRKPEFRDIFRRHPIGEPTIYPREEPRPQLEPGVSPRAPEPPIEPRPARTAPPIPEPPIAGTTVPVRAKPGPAVLVDVTPKRGGGWRYEFKIPTEEVAPKPEARTIIDYLPDIERELPPHVIPPAEKKIKPPTVRRGAVGPEHKDYKNPLWNAIATHGGIRPSVDFPNLRKVMPVGLFRKDGLAIDEMAANLQVTFPRLEGDSQLYDWLKDAWAGKAKFRGKDTTPEADAQAEVDYYEGMAQEHAEKEAAGEFEAEGAPKEKPSKVMEELDPTQFKTPLEEQAKMLVEDTRDSLGEESASSMIDLFERALADQPLDRAFSFKNYYKYAKEGKVPPEARIFGDTSIERFKNAIAYARKRSGGNFLDNNWYRTEFLGESKIEEPKDLFGRETAELKPEAKPKPIQETLFEEPTPRERKYPPPFDDRGLSRFDDINSWRKKVQPLIDEGYVIQYGHEAGAKGWGKIADKLEAGKGKLARSSVKVPEFGEEKVQPTIVEEPLIKEKPEGLEAKQLQTIRATIQKRWPKRNKSEVDEILGDISPTILENFDPKGAAALPTYTTNLLQKRYTIGGTKKTRPKPEIPPEEELKGFGPAGIPTPEGAFAYKQEVERVRKLFRKVVEPKKSQNKERDVKILEGFLIDGKSWAELAKEHGVHPDTTKDVIQRALEKLPDDEIIQQMLRERHIKLNLGPMPSDRDLRRAAKWMSRYFSSRKGATYEIDAENDIRIGGYLSEIFLATNEAKDLLKSLKKYRSDAVDRLVYDILTGETSMEAVTLPDDIKGNIQIMRDRIDNLSAMILVHGGLKRDTWTAIQNNIGKYLRRQYRLHLDKHWDPPQEARDNLIAYMRNDQPERYQDMTDDQMNDILDRVIEAEHKDSGFGGKSRQKRVNTDGYIRRKELSPEWKAFAGEIKDPYFLMMQTVSHNASMGYNAKFLNKIKEAYPDLWATTVAGDPNREGWPRLPDTYGYGKLAGKFIHPELEDYILKEVEPTTEALVKVFQQFIVNPFKWTKTIGSLPTHARNFQGNIMFSGIMRNLILNPVNSPYYVDAFKTFMLRSSSRRQEWAELVKLGVTETQFYGAEIPKLYNELMKLEPIHWSDKIADYIQRATRATVGKVIEKAGNAYNFEDALYRIAAHYKNTKHFGMSPEESVKEINLGMTNYRKLPAVVEKLRQWPLFGPFISFKYNVMKIVGSQFREAGKEMAHKGTRRKGTFRLLRILFWLGVPTMLAEFSKWYFDVDEERIDQLENYYVDYRRNGTFVYFPWKEKLKALDLSYIYPTGEFEKLARAALKGDVSSAAEAADILAHPVFDTWMIMMKGRYPQYAGAYKIEGGFFDRAAEAAKLLWIPASAPIPSFKSLSESLKAGAFKPRAGKLTGYQIKAIIDAYNQEPDSYQRVRSLPEEVKNFFTGLRTWDVDPEKELTRYIKSKRNELHAIESNAKYWMKTNTKAPQWEMFDKLAEINKDVARIMTEVKEAAALYNSLAGDNFKMFERGGKEPLGPKELKTEKPEYTRPEWWNDILQEEK